MPESRTSHGLPLPKWAIAIALVVAAVARGQATPPTATPEPGQAPQARTPGYVAFYEYLLSEIVTPAGLVRYERIATGRNRYNIAKVRAGYWRHPLPKEGPQRLAFLLNAYNSNVLNLVIEQGADHGQPLRSVKDVAGYFDEVTFQVGQVETTLDGLENDMIRPLRDPRVHAALVGGAMGCPPLRAEPYAAQRLGQQLDDQCRRFVNDPTRNRVEGDTLALSEIFKWHEADFAVEPYGGVVGFVRKYAADGGPIAALLARKPDPAIVWIPYDWALNQAPSP